MNEELGIAKDLILVATPFVKPLIDDWLKPKLRDFFSKQKVENELIEHSFCNRFEEYLKRSYAKQLILNTIVYQNEQRSIEDLYIPLTLKSTADKMQFKIVEYNDDFIPHYKKVLITDTAGMGKSTVTKWLFLSSIKKSKGIPVFIELRRLSEKTDVLQFILNELNPITNGFDKDFILKIIERGDFIFFLDGYDEIPFAERDNVTQYLQDFISKADKNYFVMSSRPELALASFGNFQKFQIMPLTVDESFELIRKYDRGTENSERLITKIKEPSTIENIKEFLYNPLLVSLLYKAYDYKPNIPYNKRVFYRQVYDALYESHDFTKGYFIRPKFSGLDIDKFHMVLRGIGYFTFTEGRVEYIKDDLIKIVKKSKEYYVGPTFSESDFLKDIISVVPVFVRDGEFYKWTHKSLQEYFCAGFICEDAKDKQEKILLKMANNKDNAKYMNVLDLCYDIDYKTFRKTVVYDFLNNFLDFCNSRYRRTDYKEINEEDIYMRLGLTFGNIIFFYPLKGVQNRSFGELFKNSNLLIDMSRGLSQLFSSKSYSFSIINESVNRMKDKEIIVFGLSYDDALHNIKMLLRRKGEDIFIDIKREITEIVLDFEIELDCPVLLEDDPDSLLNQKSTFSQINLLFFKEDMLDFKKCTSLQETINEEIEKERSANYLIENL